MTVFFGTVLPVCQAGNVLPLPRPRPAPLLGTFFSLLLTPLVTLRVLSAFGEFTLPVLLPHLLEVLLVRFTPLGEFTLPLLLPHPIEVSSARGVLLEILFVSPHPGPLGTDFPHPLD